MRPELDLLMILRQEASIDRNYDLIPLLASRYFAAVTATVNDFRPGTGGVKIHSAHYPWEIAQNRTSIIDYAARGNLVGEVSNGTAVLGLG